MLRLIVFIFFCISFYSNSCDLNSKEPISLLLPLAQSHDKPRKIIITNNTKLAFPDSAGVLKMVDAEGFGLISQVLHWPTQSGEIASIKADPVVLDMNADTLADAVYAIDSEGLLWFIPIEVQGFTLPVLIGDFRLLNARFSQPLQIIYSQTRNALGEINSHIQLLIIASRDDGDILLVVKHDTKRLSHITLDNLVNRTELGQTEQQLGISDALWQQVEQGFGWYVHFHKRINVLPKVYAGVVYLTSANVNELNSDCSLKHNSQLELNALHLHHAGTIYTKRGWLIEQRGGALALSIKQDGALALSLGNDTQQVVLTQLLAISEECASCVEVLDINEYPKFIRLATFQLELDGH